MSRAGFRPLGLSTPKLASKLVNLGVGPVPASEDANTGGWTGRYHRSSQRKWPKTASKSENMMYTVESLPGCTIS